MKKTGSFRILYTLGLVLISTFVLLDTFVIPHGTVSAEENTAVSTVTAEAGTYTDTTYSDSHIQISVTTERVDDTTVHLVDITIDDPSLLRTAFAEDTYGRNVKETTSDIASSHNAVLAINGDYYGFRNNGYVIRNGILYRSTSGNDEDLVIDKEGNFSIIRESDVTAQELMNQGAWQVFSFGPALVNNGEITVGTNTEVSQSMSSNPRTAIGMIAKGHYLFVVSEGRTSDSEGLSLYQLAELMKEKGCTVAYNLDGGGSSTLWFNGKVLNQTVGGMGRSEREVSDIVYIGYEESSKS